MRSEINFNGLRKGKFPRMRKRAGFSLLIVLIISIVGLAIIAVTMQMTVLSTGSGRVVSAGNTKYNFMQDAVELGKAILRMAMDNSDERPVYKGKNNPITDIDDLLIACKYCPDELELPDPWEFHCWEISRELNRADLGKLGIAGNGGQLVVKVYDMQYDWDAVDLANPDDEKMLPPSLELTGTAAAGSYVGESGMLPIGPSNPTHDDGFSGGPPKPPENAGVYLIRATLTIEGKRTILDTAVIQANNPEV